MPTSINYSEEKFLKFLKEEQIIPNESILELKNEAESLKRSLIEHIYLKYYINEDYLADALSRKLGFEKINLANMSFENEDVKIISSEFAQQNICLSIGKTKRHLNVAIFNPFQTDIIIKLEQMTGLSVRTKIATRTEILDAINRFYSYSTTINKYVNTIALSDFDFIDSSVGNDIDSIQIVGNQLTPENIKELSYEEAPVIKMVNLIIFEAISEKSSDVHIEPKSNFVVVRNRIDGVLHEMTKLPKWIQNGLISRFKILANLDISEKRVPQDGNIRIGLSDNFKSEQNKSTNNKANSNEHNRVSSKKSVEIRVSTLPTYYGEKIVLRILDTSNVLLNLDNLGLTSKTISLLNTTIRQPQGLILVTGPTGSGKSSTLFGCLNEINSTDINITTIENPVEYQIQGCNQVQINDKAGLTFSKTLRSILRQDPDVVMVGEIRDGETAEIAMNASITGHLVLSTLHTNDSVSTITRLLDLGVPPFLISSSLMLVVAQRLVRKVCQNCLVEYKPDIELLTKLNLHNQDIVYKKGEGCSECKHTGYKGRLGVYEFLEITSKIKDLISLRASEEKIIKIAKSQGTKFLLEDAIEKVKLGLTTVEEVARVIQYKSDVFMLCPVCSNKISPEFILCPYCFSNFSNECPSCHHETEQNWDVCPYCKFELAKEKEKITELKKIYKPVIEKVREHDYIVLKPIENESKRRTQSNRYNVDEINILLVDDDKDILNLASKALKKLNMPYNLITASNGNDALEKILLKVPNIVITDVQMPEMNGFELCTHLRKNVRTAFVPVIMLTALDDKDNITKGYLVGTDDYIVKPFNMSEFLARVERVLKRTYGL